MTARLIMRRVRAANPDHVQVNARGKLFRAWRHHPFFTDNTEPVAEADITHRRPART